jgi:hypothetical protein
MSFCLTNQINGLGLLGQTIKSIKEEGTTKDIKSYEEYTEYRKEEENKFLGKFEKFNQKNDKLKEFLEKHYNQYKFENDTKLKFLEQRIHTIEKANNILKTDFTEIVNDFKKNLDEPIKNEKNINKMLEDWRLIESYQGYFERNVEMINELMHTKLSIDSDLL